MKKSFGTARSGQAVDEWTLTNSHGAVVRVITRGGIITEILVPDRNGELGSVVLGFDSIAEYETQTAYIGAAIGRFCNRIAGGKFSLDGKSYQIPRNDHHIHALHGGDIGFDRRVWTAEKGDSTDGQSVRLSLVDPAGSQGFPGTVHAIVIYTLTESNALRVDFRATADQSTPINLTQHTYFNLKDAGASPITDHTLQIDGDFYLPGNVECIPTGEVKSVTGTPIDFTQPRRIGDRLLAMGGEPAGYDHNLVLRSQDGSLARAGEVYEPTTGRTMQVWTTQPGMQFYSGNFLDGTIVGRGGVKYQQHHAFCLETQHYPDAVNRPEWPTTILRPGQKFRQVTEYRFGVLG